MEIFNKLKFAIINVIIFLLMGLLLYVGIYNLHNYPVTVVGGLALVSSLLIYSSYRVIQAS
ncbi:hypothetical protein [Natranaerobius thermophilus]|uniref:Uncharacterized protein n=1 Tax=Natranaerobius thermophilus (strain ATCC BAA-1301 / DSM 18059 / JW/NM-WN-LF) TaxID=457570 RepID=B2A1C7_NATTJ|nr:hypothetical protein [Natranaerobius thermophilus]ACB86065.1 hypothetical protein Nther_2502 [Natranaerobius thermophilus JW/NM-WN-LF]